MRTKLCSVLLFISQKNFLSKKRKLERRHCSEKLWPQKRELERSKFSEKLLAKKKKIRTKLGSIVSCKDTRNTLRVLPKDHVLIFPPVFLLFPQEYFAIIVFAQIILFSSPPMYAHKPFPFLIDFSNRLFDSSIYTFRKTKNTKSKKQCLRL